MAGAIRIANSLTIAQGMAPFDPGLASVAAGRLVLGEVSSFAFSCHYV